MGNILVGLVLQVVAIFMPYNTQLTKQSLILVFRDRTTVNILVGLVTIFIICNTPNLARSACLFFLSLLNKDFDENWTYLSHLLTNLVASVSHTLNILIFATQVLSMAYTLCFI